MQKQKGMTFISFLVTIVALLMAVVVIVRVIPVYYQYFSIMSSVKSLNSTPASSLSSDPMLAIAELRKSMSKRLEINGLEELKTQELIITPTNKPNQFTVRVKYQVIKPLVYNVSLLFDFDCTREVIAGSEN